MLMYDAVSIISVRAGCSLYGTKEAIGFVQEQQSKKLITKRGKIYYEILVN